jgi:hypothetical protein
MKKKLQKSEKKLLLLGIGRRTSGRRGWGSRAERRWGVAEEGEEGLRSIWERERERERERAAVLKFLDLVRLI